MPAARGEGGTAGPRGGRTFDRTRRVRCRADFLRAQQEGVRVTTAHFVLLLHASGVPGPARLGLVVSRKVGVAVVRNRVKRVIRECFRAMPGFAPDGVDVVVIPRPGAQDLSPAEIAAEWSDVQALVQKKGRQVLAQTAGAPHLSPAASVSSARRRLPP